MRLLGQLRGGRWRSQYRCYSSQATNEYDVVFIGAGPGGYVGAIKAAQLGLRTASIERRATLGGTCLNVGCIPSKSLLHNSHLYHLARHEFPQRGIRLPEGVEVQLDLPAMMKAKERSVKALTGGVEYLFRKNGVTRITGSARIVGPNEVEVTSTSTDKSEPTRIRAKNIVIATGSESSHVPLPGLKDIDEKRVVSSTGALELTEVPRQLVVIGGGIIGLELGSVWSRLGSTVTVVEMAESVGGGLLDGTIANAFTKILQKQGLRIHLNTRVMGLEDLASKSAKTSKLGKSDSLLVNVNSKADGDAQLEADVVLVSVGRKPMTEGLGLAEVGVELDERGRVKIIDNQFRTSIPSIRAIGDVIRGPMLAHKAEEEGVAVAEFLAPNLGHGHMNYDAIPSVIYTHPEVAWVGKSEEAVKAEGIDYQVGSFPFMANSRAKTVEDAEGLVKVITERATDRLLGVHILGPAAGELIGEATLALEYGASSEDIARTCHAHPTLSEALKEACLSAHGLRKAINA